MWMLVMLLVTANGPMFQSQPKPMSQEECQQAKVATEQQIATQFKDKNIKAEFKCVPLGEEKTE